MTEWTIEKHGKFNRKIYAFMISLAGIRKPWEVFQTKDEYEAFGDYGGQGQIMFSKGRGFDLLTVFSNNPELSKTIARDFIFYSELYGMECDIDRSDRDLITNRLSRVFERKGYT